MSALPKLVVDGQDVAPFKWSRAVARRSPARKYLAETLRRHRRAKASGVLVAMMNLGFAPTLTLFVAAATTSTTTIPSGASNVEIQAWGGGGDGGSLGTGGGGGGGAYSRCTLACATANGKTLVVTCTQTAIVNQTCPGYTVQSGSFTISTITAGCGTGGNGVNLGQGGAASNANSGAVNTPGNNGTAGGAGTHGHGGAGIAGNVTGDGSPYGTGASSNTAGAAQLGAVVLYYT